MFLKVESANLPLKNDPTSQSKMRINGLLRRRHVLSVRLRKGKMDGDVVCFAQERTARSPTNYLENENGDSDV